MIVYPVIIIGLLLILFFMVLRKAYLIKPDDLAEEAIAEDSRAKEDFSSGKIPLLKDGLKLLKLRRRSDVEIETNFDTETDPNIQKADYLFKKKRFISAEKWYLEAVKANPKNAKIYSRLGLIYLRQKNYRDATEALNEAVKLDGGTASRFFNLSFAHNNLGEIKEAIALVRKSIRLEPDNKKYRRYLEDLKARNY